MSAYFLSLTVSIKFVLENTEIAGAVVYNMAINSNAQPADLRASATFFTVKNRTITWGKPAVPTINAAVIQKTSSLDLLPVV